MLDVIAAIRPGEWNLPLFLHVLGAFVLIGTAGAGAILSLTATGVHAEARRSLAFRCFLLGAIPSYVVMRVGGEWLYDKEFDGVDPQLSWINIGYVTADATALILLVTLLLSRLGAQRGKPGLVRIAGILSVIAVIAWLVAVWAMGAKPS